MRIISNVKVGKAKVKQTTPTHILGTREGNQLHGLSHTRGLHKRKHGTMVKATASRSTGVNALFRNSIVPGAPRLTPM